MDTFRSEDAKPSRSSRLAFLRRAGTLGAAAAGAGALARPAPTEVVRVETVEREGAAEPCLSFCNLIYYLPADRLHDH